MVLMNKNDYLSDYLLLIGGNQANRSRFDEKLGYNIGEGDTVGFDLLPVYFALHTNHIPKRNLCVLVYLMT